jgi:uncharacterized protein YsxB (DUF464 family)
VIRIYAITDTLDAEGGSTLAITGHANEKVCAGVSALWETVQLGLEKIAKEYPREARFERIVRAKPKKKPAR